MTSNGHGPAALTRPLPEARTAPRSVDAVTLLSCYLFLLMVIPPRLVVGSFGGAGAPAALFAGVLLCWYLIARQHPALSLDRLRAPVQRQRWMLAGARSRSGWPGSSSAAPSSPRTSRRTAVRC